jgi:predicted nuclease of predicted toxin-antitoxin system
MRFKVDENLPVEATALLLKGGHDARTVLQQGLGGQPDADVAHACQCEQRILVTLDIDFADIRTYPPEQFHGLIVLRLRQQDTAHVLDALRRLLQLFASESIQGQLWIVEEDRIRIRD